MLRNYFLSLSFVVGLILLSSQAVSANDSRSGQSECDCNRSNSKENKVVISFERAGRRLSKKRNDTIWFRLHNGRSCPIFVPTDHEYGLKTDSGQTTIAINDGSVVFVKYEIKIFRLDKSRRPVESQRWVSYLGGTTYTTSLPAGNSLLFYIPISNLKRAAYLSVPYVCEKASNFSSKAPRVIFNLRNLPKKI